MNARFDPLTARLPRTLRELDRDPFDWIRRGECEAAGEEHIRAMFNDELPRETLPPNWPGRIVYVLGLCAFVALVLSFCKRG